MDKKYLNEYINLKYSDIKGELTPNQIKLIKDSVEFNKFILNKCVKELIETLEKDYKKFSIKLKSIFRK